MLCDVQFQHFSFLTPNETNKQEYKATQNKTNKQISFRSESALGFIIAIESRQEWRKSIFWKGSSRLALISVGLGLESGRKLLTLVSINTSKQTLARFPSIHQSRGSSHLSQHLLVPVTPPSTPHPASYPKPLGSGAGLLLPVSAGSLYNSVVWLPHSSSGHFWTFGTGCVLGQQLLLSLPFSPLMVWLSVPSMFNQDSPTLPAFPLHPQPNSSPYSCSLYFFFHPHKRNIYIRT